MPWSNRLDRDQWLEGEREGERKKANGGPPPSPSTRRSWFVRNARRSRENRDSGIIDTFQRVKKENSFHRWIDNVRIGPKFRKRLWLPLLTRNRFLREGEGGGREIIIIIIILSVCRHLEREIECLRMYKFSRPNQKFRLLIKITSDRMFPVGRNIVFTFSISLHLTRIFKLLPTQYK